MTYTHCQSCGGGMNHPVAKNYCLKCGWTPGLNWHRDTPTGWTPERAKACYDYCEGVDVDLLTPGGLERLRDAYADLQVRVDALEGIVRIQGSGKDIIVVKNVGGG